MLFSLDDTLPDTPFPPSDLAEKDPDGLLAVGGDLSTTRLLNAYRSGIFPWYSEGQPILWWSPDPRIVLLPEELHISRSLRKTMRQQVFNVTYDQAFEQVIELCANAPRKDQNGTWILPEMILAYTHLYNEGHAHSVEVWKQNTLVGGLYGVAIGKAFYGESMFSLVSNASKVGFATLVKQLAEWKYKLVDCQVETDHLISLGAHDLSRKEFLRLNRKACNETADHDWKDA